VTHVDAEDVVELAAADDQDPVEQLAAGVAHPALHVPAFGAWNWVRMTVIPSFAKMKRRGELLIAVVHQRPRPLTAVVKVHQ
jgi:hypothetical protein